MSTPTTCSLVEHRTYDSKTKQNLINSTISSVFFAISTFYSFRPASVSLAFLFLACRWRAVVCHWLVNVERLTHYTSHYLCWTDETRRSLGTITVENERDWPHARHSPPAPLSISHHWELILLSYQQHQYLSTAVQRQSTAGDNTTAWGDATRIKPIQYSVCFFFLRSCFAFETASDVFRLRESFFFPFELPLESDSLPSVKNLSILNEGSVLIIDHEFRSRFFQRVQDSWQDFGNSF